MGKKYALQANDKNLVSTCIGLIKRILKEKRGNKYFESFPETLREFAKRVDIPKELEQKVSNGYTKWEQAIRNAAKVHRDKKTPDALTQGELMALEDGGFALPDHVPDGRTSVKFPDIAGLKISEHRPHKPYVKQTETFRGEGRPIKIEYYERRGDKDYGYPTADQAVLADIVEDAFKALDNQSQDNILHKLRKIYMKED